MSDTNEKPTIDERYVQASNASNLAVKERVTGSADMLIAAGWSNSLVGKALLRLHSEFDGTSKPRAIDPRSLEQLAVSIARERALKAAREKAKAVPPAVPTEQDRKAAREKAAEWMLHEQKLMLGRLKTLPFARDLLVTGCRERWKWEEAEAKVAAVLIWWLDRNCLKCHGTKVEMAAKRQGSRPCRSCHGTGERHVPCEDEGRQLVTFLDDCVNRARAQMSRSLRTTAKQG